MDIGALSAALKQYRANESISPAQLRLANRARFRELAQFAAEHSPYYRRLVERHRVDLDRAGPEDCPPLTKADLIRHFDESLTAREISAAKAHARPRAEPAAAGAREQYTGRSRSLTGAATRSRLLRSRC